MVMSTVKDQKVQIVTFSTLFPNKESPIHGVFVRNRLQHLVATKPVSARVVAPVPWFPFKSAAFGRYSQFARVERHEDQNGISITHPRYPLIPKAGMLLAPAALFAGSLSAMKKLQREKDLLVIE